MKHTCALSSCVPHARCVYDATCLFVMIVIVITVITYQDSTSSRLLPGSSYSCCSRNLHALVHKQCTPVCGTPMFPPALPQGTVQFVTWSTSQVLPKT
jgi:hypothetical protein